MDDVEDDAWSTASESGGSESSQNALPVADAAAEGQPVLPRTANTKAIIDHYRLDDIEMRETDELSDEDVHDPEQVAEVFGLAENSLAVFSDNKDDPYITLPDNEADSDDEDEMIKPTDCVLVCARAEETQCLLEVCVYDENTCSLYTHHQNYLPEFPLCLEWMGSAANGGDDGRLVGNYAAVGTFRPEIEIWNLDVHDAVDPIGILGGEGMAGLRPLTTNSVRKGGKGKKKKSKPALVPGSHTAGVLSLSWHPSLSHLLASGSADNTIKLWDINTLECVHTHTGSKDKIQSLKWHPSEVSLLLSASLDGNLRLCDVRTEKGVVAKWKLPSDPECLQWRPGSTSLQAALSMEDGSLALWDIRVEGDSSSSSSSSSSPLAQFQPHESSTTAFVFNRKDPALVATVSMDASIKLWHWDTDSGSNPECLATRSTGAGSLFSASFFDASAPYLLAVGGEKDVVLWDISENKSVVEHFPFPDYVAPSVVQISRTMETVSIMETEGVHEDPNESFSDSEAEGGLPTAQDMKKSKQKKDKKKKKW